MPVKKCSNGKYRIGSGKCIYKSKASADRAYKGYLGSKHMNEKINIEENNGLSQGLSKQLEDINEKVDLKAATVDEDDMKAKDLKQMMRLAGIENDLADEDKRTVDFRGTLHKPVSEGKFCTLRELEEILQGRINLSEEYDGVTSFDLDELGLEILKNSNIFQFVDYSSEDGSLKIPTSHFRPLVDVINHGGGQIYSDDSMNGNHDSAMASAGADNGYFDEDAPEGWEGTVKAMKGKKGIDNPYALAQYMAKKGYKSHRGPRGGELDEMPYDELHNIPMGYVGEDGAEDKKLGRRKAGSWGRPGSREQRRIASKAVRKKAKIDLKNVKTDEGQSNLGLRGERPNVGDEVETIFGHGTVVDVIDHGNGKIHFLVKHTDYRDADGDTFELSGFDVHKISEADHIADPHGGSMISPYEGEPSSQEVENALDHINNELVQFLDTDMMAKATLDDLKHDKHPEDIANAILDLISDATGFIRNYLDNNDMLYFSDKEIENIVKENFVKMGLVSEGIDLSSGTYDRLVMEMILAEMKFGKTPEEIAEELAFDEDQVKVVYETVTNVKKN